MRDNGGRQGDLGLRHQFSVTDDIGIFPPDMKIKIVENLTKCLELDLDPEQKTLVQGLINTVQNSEFSQAKWNYFVDRHTRLDKIRNENHLALIPNK